MPIIKSAAKKVRIDVRRRSRNLAQGKLLKAALKKARTSKKFADVSSAYSALDRAVKTNLIHRNLANREKAALSKLAKPTKLSSPRQAPARAKPARKITVKRAAAKRSPRSKPAR